MKRVLVLLTAAFTGLAPGAKAAFVSDAEVQPVMQRTVDDVIIPGYSAFRTAAEAAASSMNQLCIANDASSYQGARAAFANLVSAWSRIEVLRDGPVLDNNMFERILFFPDRKGLALKQIQALLAAKDENAIAGASMKSKSVAVQGLTGLEFVLSGSGSEELASGKDNFRCHAGRAIAANIALLAGELSDAWNEPDGIAGKWRKPGPDNPVFRNGEEALIALLGILVRGLETTNEKRLMIFSTGEGGANPKKALYWRSGMTMKSVEDNLKGLRAFWDESGMQYIIRGEGSAITTNINFDFHTAISTAGKLDMPVDKMLADEKAHSRLEFLIMTVADLQARLNNDYGRAMGLAAGFTFSDGD
ncbi:MAG TPA: imelysin family protein [Ensifer sp.]|nr:imelysin family protein [Ensifer sp.]